jgi:cell division protein FtsI (penicillin-binding protein 3)
VVASFAGFAPVNNPAISVTVVIDEPTVGILYGAEVSAPVFREVAQEVLEYLGVPHDQALKSAQQMKEAQNTVEPDDVPDQHLGDLNAMYDEVNSLPADDPLRHPANAAAMAENRSADEAYEAAVKERPKPVGIAALPDKVLAAINKHEGASARPAAVMTNDESVSEPAIRPQVQVRDNGAVVVDPGKRVAVPDFHGNDLRSVVERAGDLRLRVRTLGSGLAQDQAPLAGTMVPLGTEIVVRFTR